MHTAPGTTIYTPLREHVEDTMKLALCLEYPIDQHGGTEVLVSELIRGLGDRHHILLVSPDDSASLARSKVAGFVKEHIPWRPDQISVERSRWLTETLAKAGVDLAHFHFGGNYAWGNRLFWQCPIVHLHRAGVPCLSTNHGAFSIIEGYCWHLRPLYVKLALFLPAWFSKQYVLACLDAEVAVSKHDYFALRRWYWPMRAKFRQIYHSRLREPLPAPNPNREKVILCTGTIGYRKGQNFLVDAFCRLAPRHPDWNLVLIGRNGDEMIMRLIQDSIARHNLADRIQWLGERSDTELVDWLRRSAIFAIPSTQEGLGLSLQEAQFHGCACVGTRCGGVEDLIQDGDNGLLVPVGEVTPLADALERLMTDEALRARLSTRAPQSVLEKGMTTNKMVENYERLYADILRARKS